MSKKQMLIACRLFFALLALAAVVTQLVYGVAKSNLDPANFYSYFTIESNILALTVLLVSAWALYRGKQDRQLDYLRGAVTLYMLITGLIYSILLTGVDVNVPLPWVNSVLHYILPVVLVADWLADRPRRAIPWRGALIWLVFPVVYFSYSLVRGHYTGWYPYPFMDVSELGYNRVALNATVIAAGMVLLAIAVAKLGKPAGKGKH